MASGLSPPHCFSDFGHCALAMLRAAGLFIVPVLWWFTESQAALLLARGVVAQDVWGFVHTCRHFGPDLKFEAARYSVPWDVPAAVARLDRYAGACPDNRRRTLCHRLACLFLSCFHIQRPHLIVVLCTEKAVDSQGSSEKFLQKSASGCDCSWIANDDCISQDSCAVSCRQQFGKSCGGSGNEVSDAACRASCDSAYSSCDRWCHISDATGSYYTAAEEEAMKGEILQCGGQCSVTRGTCYQKC